MAGIDYTSLHGSLSTGSLSGNLSGDGKMRGALDVPKVITVYDKDYSHLDNKPSINGVELSGDMSAQDLYIVSENTTSGWNSNPQYLPKKGEICIYTDHYRMQDDMGNELVYPAIKIGDGNAYLIDLPFVGDGDRYYILQQLRAHETDTIAHVTQQDRNFWNNKLNFSLDGEELILTRL